MAEPLRIKDAVYLGGFDYLGLTEPRWGTLVLSDETIALTDVQSQNLRRYPDLELCRIRAVASLEVTSEQVAKSKVGATLLFGVWGGLAAKGAADRSTIVLHLKSGVTGYIIVKKLFSAQLLGIIEPWRRTTDIQLTDQLPVQPEETTRASIADELTKLAQLRDSGVLSEDEFVLLKTDLIRNHTGRTVDDLESQ